MKYILIACIMCLTLSPVSATADSKKNEAYKKEVLKEIKEANKNLVTLYRIGRYKRALDYAKIVVKAAEHELGPEHPETLKAFYGLASIHGILGNYQAAEPLFKRTILLQEKVFGKEHELTLNTINNLANLYLRQRKYKVSQELFEKLLKINIRVAGKNSLATLATQLNLASVYERQIKVKKALDLYEKVHKISTRKFGSNNSFTLKAKLSLAMFYRQLGRYSKAERLLKSLLKTHQKMYGKSHPETLENLAALATLYTLQEKWEQSDKILNQAIKISKTVYGDHHPNTLLRINSQALNYHYKKQWNKSLDLFRQSTAGLIARSQLMSSHTLAKPTSSAAQKNLIYFQIYLKTAYEAANRSKKSRNQLGRETFSRLQWIQEASAAEALSQMAARASSGDKVLSDLIRSRQDLTRKWAGLDQQLVRTFTSKNQKRTANLKITLKTKLSEIEAQIAKLDEEIQKKRPDFDTLTTLTPLTVAQVQKLLRKDEAAVYIISTHGVASKKGYIIQPETYVWVVTATEFKWVRSKGGYRDASIAVKTLRCGLDGAFWNAAASAKECRKLTKSNYSYQDYQNGEPLPFDLKTAHRLYQKLFSKIETTIKGKKLLLAPTGPLASLPFQVLVTTGPSKKTTLVNAEWLIKKHTLAVLPSISSLKSLRQSARLSNAKNPFLGIGNPLLLGRSGTDKSAWEKQNCNFKPNLRTQVAANRNLKVKTGDLFRSGKVNIALLKKQPPLPETADELCTVAKLVGAPDNSVYLGANATETNLKKMSDGGQLKDFKIIHFATHGLVSGETAQLAKNHAEPSLLLTPPSKPTKTDDGLLTSSEITRLKLDADWVILSACNTAAGGDTFAEPLSGLAKAFFYAGARALLVSHWAVETKATVELVTKSIRALTSKPEAGRAEALQSAILDLIKTPDYSHPSFWAPFVLVGEGGKASL